MNYFAIFPSSMTQCMLISRHNVIGGEDLTPVYNHRTSDTTVFELGGKRDFDVIDG